jgi:hypothetical protein
MYCGPIHVYKIKIAVNASHNYDLIVNSYPLFGLKLAGDFAQIGELI